MNGVVGHCGLIQKQIVSDHRTARAFRIYIPLRSPGTASGGYMNLSMSLMSEIGGANICHMPGNVLPTGAICGESSRYNNSPMYNAENGFKHAREAIGLWHSSYQNAPWWAWIDFGVGNEKTVREISIAPVNTLENERTPFEFYLQTSLNATSNVWTDLLHVNNIIDWTLNVEKSWTIP